MRRGSAAQNRTIALSHCTATNTAASLSITNESLIAGAVCISLLATRPGELILEEAEALSENVTVCLPAHLGLEWRRKHLTFEEFVTEDDRRARDEDHERHPHQNSGMVVEKARRNGSDLHEVDQLCE